MGLHLRLEVELAAQLEQRDDVALYLDARPDAAEDAGWLVGRRVGRSHGRLRGGRRRRRWALGALDGGLVRHPGRRRRGGPDDDPAVAWVRPPPRRAGVRVPAGLRRRAEAVR